MKKFVRLICALILVISLTACSKGTEDIKDSSKPNTDIQKERKRQIEHI